jgi:signal transduction histidine kinase
MARTLSEIGRVVSATSVEDARTALESGGVDLVVTDQRMPGGTGVDLLEHVTAHDPAIGRILLTAYADQEATVQAINRGQVHAYLHKPCLPDQLLVTARTILDRVRLWRENQRLLREATEHNEKLEAALSQLHHAQDRMLHAERLSAIGTMTAMVVHDLRSPISLIHSASGELVRDAESLGSGEVRSLGQAVRDESDRLERLSAELLDITRHSTASCATEETALDDVVAEVATSLTRDAAHQGVEVDLELTSAARLPLHEESLRRALSNLICNALEAMSDGGRLLVRTEATRDEATIRIVDSGPGVPEEIRSQAFEPFVTSGKPRGTGLGLAIVKKVVEDHGGRVTLEKAEGGGAAFEIQLPTR